VKGVFSYIDFSKAANEYDTLGLLSHKMQCVQHPLHFISEIMGGALEAAANIHQGWRMLGLDA
jgi:hypothetical protein